jgi:hypothetical protein
MHKCVYVFVYNYVQVYLFRWMYVHVYSFKEDLNKRQSQGGSFWDDPAFCLSYVKLLNICDIWVILM